MKIKQVLIDFIASILFHIGRFCALFSSVRESVYFIFPLATIGGAELVHLDVVKAIRHNNKKVLFWHKTNPWSDSKLLPQKSLEKEYSKYSEVIFFEDKLKFRIQSWPKNFWLGFYSGKINRKNNIVFVRNGDDEFKNFLKRIRNKKFKLFVITHNAFAESVDKDTLLRYMDFDIKDQIDKRIIISGSLEEVQHVICDHFKLTNSVPNVVIHNCVEIENDKSEKSFDKIDVLFAGRDANEKRFYLVYEIAKELEDNPNIHFHFAGPSDHNYAPLKNATFYGEVTDQDEMHDLYFKTNAFILLSKSEGFPRSIAEAMGCGNIIISTNVGSIKDHISSSNGYLIYSTDDFIIKNEVKSILNSLVSNDSENLKMSSENWKYAKDNFTFEVFSEKYNALIHGN